MCQQACLSSPSYFASVIEALSSLRYMHVYEAQTSASPRTDVGFDYVSVECEVYCGRISDAFANIEGERGAHASHDRVSTLDASARQKILYTEMDLQARVVFFP